jgi:hypothetical protein
VGGKRLPIAYMGKPNLSWHGIFIYREILSSDGQSDQS